MLLIKNGKVLTMAGITYEKGCILVEDGKIKEIGESIVETENMEIIDAKGGWVMPGIIEAHCHIGIMEEDKGFEGNDTNEMTDPVTPQLRAIDAINPMDTAFNDAVEGGVTSVMTGPGSANVVGGQFVFMKTKGKSIDDMIVKEPAAMKIAFGENPKRVYSGKGKMPATRMATAALLRETLTKAAQYKEKKEKALAKGEDFTEDFKQEAWLPVLNQEIPLKAHAHRSDDILTAIRIGKEFNLHMTLDHCSEGHFIPEYVAASSYPAIIGPTLTRRSKIEVQNKTFKTPGIVHKAGTLVALTTDHPVIPVQYLSKCAGLAAKEGLGIEEGLKAITINAATICGVADRVGSLEVGKDADIAIFSGNPMEIFTDTLYTIIDGQIVYKA
ncbi:amidohydrolase [Zhenhengia yiwuensis]|uniref:Amidohydrolase n=2 Tax=Zhenhengia TaxID=2944196 RepID=A0A926IF67_9FIRM|nr:amidohydrolase [Zhenhengia yiwuensis]MBC8580704.1 amidohydrolase [Zhenhengia yiwuensis]MDU6360300.1 amidohydrolase [Clostridiales bacterium]MDY3368654.1 amidohydrolase [Zhenhengia yiwuensis]